MACAGSVSAAIRQRQACWTGLKPKGSDMDFPALRQEVRRESDAPSQDSVQKLPFKPELDHFLSGSFQMLPVRAFADGRTLSSCPHHSQAPFTEGQGAGSSRPHPLYGAVSRGFLPSPLPISSRRGKEAGLPLVPRS